jgi:hypothetical protein
VQFKTTKFHRMTKPLKPLLLVLFTTILTYLGFSNSIDPALVLSHIKTPEDKVITEIQNHHDETIFLKAGNEKFGFNHILKRHSDDYFKDFDQKGKLFPTGTTGKQIIKGIETVYKFGEPDKKAYGDKKVLHREVTINGEKATYRLVMNDQNEVITFYKIK